MTSRDAADLVQEEKKVEAAKRIAGLVGPALIAITTSEVVNLEFVEDQYRFYSYANGTVVFVAGLAIVRAHNRWTRRWPVAVTLTGWGTMLLGLFRMFALEAKQGGANIPTFTGIAIRSQPESS